ncbi:hypothetical protein MGG_00932 [Pyricularia oryzae 70-15]|uniref:Alpha/beta hydrolase fold-3 domain-containing protein n=3 Tax=Pyricularia oryzae TaxID=318829 RepID=G4NDE7_PYRO7|nr:uncharacterized protein MGG_00932 [Pyricularia oryzae 70-15]EHA48436.1 hypothetical protein MGG_00932 [Pyricularia oryzae 70-15]ELQ43162.1 hypothetical protein OOU_Y34scaffold00168g6 [Pyricularia oryzae Y34]KAI7917189.1 hypothetical protein M9X92_007511 [Pyricularia oryzae]KAI7917997.1 hypothetical protein M0657_007813 [Pyricularia oryzae]
MPRWHTRLPLALRPIRAGSWCRTFASGSNCPRHEQISVRCGSSGHIAVDLHNHLYHPPTAPLVIYLPSFSRQPHLSPPLPEFIKRYPTAVINYRWPEDSILLDLVPAGQNSQPEDDSIVPTNPLHWPTPIHDTLFGYSWITDNLVPPDSQRRDIYVVGSYLGASLAASLALTESHTHERMAVRGVALYNGIYDWTAFLPPQNNNPSTDALAAMKSLLELPDDDAEGSAMHYLRQLVPTLFKTPSNLFDPFASAVLFFRSTGLLVPSSFEPSGSTIPPELERAIAELSLDEASTPVPGSPEAARLEVAFKAPRKGYMAFPPRQSMLRIPEALILHETGTVQPGRGRGRKRSTASRNNFASQAKELARVMRRSISLYEMRERMRLDDIDEGAGAEAERRVQLRDLGTEDVAEDALGPAVEEWLEEKMNACDVTA